MNRAGFLFGERRQVDLVGFLPGSASHDESAVSQAFSVFNTQAKFDFCDCRKWRLVFLLNLV